MILGRGLTLFFAIIIGLLATPGAASDVAGEWSFKVVAPDGDHAAKLSITQDGEKIGGAFASEQGQFKVEGTIKGEAIQFTVRYTGDETMDIPFSGKLQGDKMAGEYKAGEITGAWTAEKVK